ncbi:translocation/assembly module TamB domain-containing protein [Robertkochia aurantiaca]|uniref:translocation/assembly module TamB domain-containing protein n=1 Tax=Robertkochia aurantiaca TaxID=2873700 RepID=UPI001CCB12DE|nr:translocation/assembly module TamB domain-containing protein [Robertkochia sp. 3YJGBD-33]
MIGIFLITGVFLSLPPVQNGIANKLTTWLNETYNTKIQVEDVYISLFLGDVSLRKVYIEDYQGDTLIYASRLNTSLLNLKDIARGDLSFGDIEGHDLYLNITTYEGENNSNLDVFVEKLDSGESTGEPFVMTASSIEIQSGRFLMIDKNKENARLLGLEQITAAADDFRIEGPNVSLDIRDLAFETARGVTMEHLQASFTYSKEAMKIDSLKLETPESEVNGYIHFNYNREDFADFINKVKIDGRFENSTLSLNELNKFYSEFGTRRKVDMSASFSGVLNDLNLEDVSLRSENTSVKGDFYFKNLIENNDRFRMDARIQNISSNYSQLVSLMPNLLGNTLPSTFERFGQFNLGGRIDLTTEKIYSKVELKTALGNAYSDITLTNIDNIDQASYKGFLSLNDFDLGGYIESSALGTTTLDVDVDGKGFNKNTLNTEVIGKIFKLNYNGYEYNDIRVSGVIKDQLFDGKLTAGDENFDVDFEGLADLSGENNEFNFVADVNRIELNTLNLFKRDSLAVFQGRIQMNAQGSSIDNFRGELNFSNTQYTNEDDTFYFEDFSISSRFEGEERVIEVNSPDIITGYVRGVFKIGEIDKLVMNSVGSIYTNYDPYKITPGQNLDFNLKIYNKIVEVFFPEIEFGSNTFIRGSMEADEGDFKLTFRSPLIDAYGNVFENINLNVDNKNPLFNTYVEVSEIKSNVYDVSNFSLINTKIKDTLFFRTEFKGGEEYDDRYSLNFYHTFTEKRQSVIGLKRSELSFKGHEWIINENNNRQNKVIFDNSLDTINIEQVVMNYKNEEIRLEGTLIDTTYKDIDLEFEKVELQNITPAIDSLDMRGTVDGYLNILQQNTNYYPSSNVKITDFAVNDVVLGNFFLSIFGNDNLRNYGVNTKIVRNNKEVLNIFGDINYRNQESNFSLQGKMQDMNLEPFSPLGGEVLDQLRGYASGNFVVKGPINNPDINGSLSLQDAGLRIPYLNLDVAFNQGANIILNSQSIVFNNVTLTDTEYKTQANLLGVITHDYFTDWYLDLDFNTLGDRFLVLNTEQEENSLYYGTGFISGTSKIYGQTDELINIEVTASTEKGTVFKIPISDETSIGDFSYINFIDKTDAENGNGKRQLAEVQGLEMQFDLDVTPEADIEIVVDQKTGSSLRGSGAGNLLIEVNTNGKFRMWGDFLTFDGQYNFKYGGIIDKTFKVLPNGSIVWEGDPLGANVDIWAQYSLNANPSVLLDNAQYTRKIETEVRIHMMGELMQPRFEYQIEFPTASAVTNSELQYRLEDETKRELQVFSLLSQGTFINEFSIGNQALTGNLAQTASSMFNDILNSGDGKFDVGVSYEVGERNPEQDFVTEDRLGVTVSTQISDRVLINGKIGMPIGGVSESVVAGNVEVQILLNEDGTLRATIFNRENEITQFFAQQQGYTQGVGLSYEVDFDTFRELLRKLFGKQEEEQEGLPGISKTPQKQKSFGNGLVKINSEEKGGAENDNDL